MRRLAARQEAKHGDDHPADDDPGDRAAQTPADLGEAAHAPLIDAAKVFYVEGYFLTHGTESALEIAKKASETGKVRPLSSVHALVVVPL